MIGLGDYLTPSPGSCRRQWHEIQRRPTPRAGVRGGVFLPVETLLCAAASLLVEHRRYGGNTSHLASEPVPALAALFRRPPSSILAKMANLDGSRPHGATFDRDVGDTLLNDLDHLAIVYRTVLAAARAAGLGTGQLPDFLGVEHSGSLLWLGQDEIDSSIIEAELRRALASAGTDESPDSVKRTEQRVLTLTRIGQHRFAGAVMSNCGQACVFCGMALPGLAGQRLLRASHIKPWRDSNSRERLDPRNGLAACPTHDAAFDAGLLSVNGGLRIHVSSRLDDAMQEDPVAGWYFRRPPLGRTLVFPDSAERPAETYLDWHHTHVFAA